MKARIIRVGTSQGARIPKPYLDQTGIRADVDIEVHDKAIVIRSAQRPREGWGEAFQAMAGFGDDLLIDPQSANQSSWDRDEWHW
jgi:antitoxin MazE